ncbi:MAG: hydroxymethylbilane synthase [Cognatishimia sp.]|uniref:hydroxymethylbilane synthase n=1 Tax=Cognatishimia sp. 1_MG-2023 TaxID=3062642 RepID=UPI0026E3951F|nr:hydroxymethylbilane synthase [Cognatishimia sp. 1_MG-2023]MDO6727620.1 hydroxymethylbilane synthase [Cognatishimia sp. 1_MG-2023]
MTVTLPSPDSPLKIGTRGSPLALAQAYETRERLMGAFELPEAAFEIVVIKTTGDDRTMIDADRPLKEIGNKGLFTKEIEEAMLDGSIDISVHSTKDMPTEQPEGLVLDVFLPREDVRDAFISAKYKSLIDLPEGAVVGTSSLRRKAQLMSVRPDLKVVEFRGNVQTRLQKLADGVADCSFLAMAGLRRLGLENKAASAIEPDDMLPAVAQGAIGIERRADDAVAEHLLAALHHAETGTRVLCERAFLRALDGSCETPIAALSEIVGTQIHLRGEVLKTDGSQRLQTEGIAPLEEAEALGRALGEQLLKDAGPGFFDK